MCAHNPHKGQLFTAIEELKMERVNEIVGREFALADTLDVKTSIVLAIVVFLATQSDSFFHAGLLPHIIMLQYVSIGAQVVAGLCAVFALRPRKYGAEREITGYDKWIDTIRDNHSEDAEGTALRVIIEKRANRAKQRAERYVARNEEKARLLGLAFYFTAGATILNLATLVSRLC